MYKAYFIDLDGTMYSGSTNIDGAREFIDYTEYIEEIEATKS